MVRSRKRLLWPVAVAIAIVAAPPAAASVAGAGAQAVTIIAADYHFAPDQLTFKRGVAYRLRVENNGKELHEFNAPAFFQAVELADPSLLDADRTEIAVRPGEAKELLFVPKKPGHYRLICPDHDWAGMIGEITIE